MHATLLSLVALTVGFNGEAAKPAAASPLLGSWKVQLSQEVKDVAQKMGMPAPQAEFVFNPDYTFNYLYNSGSAKNSWTGRYDVHDHEVSLICPSQDWPLQASSAKFDESSLTINGLRFVHPVISLTGTWTVHNSLGLEDKSIKMQFKPNGTFAFNAPGASSKGTYTLIGSQVFLKWSEVDGEKVDFDMHKTLSISDDGLSFMIDTYKYARP